MVLVGTARDDAIAPWSPCPAGSPCAIGVFPTPPWLRDAQEGRDPSRPITKTLAAQEASVTNISPYITFSLTPAVDLSRSPAPDYARPVPSILPEIIEPAGVHLGIRSRVRDLPMPQVGRQGPRIDALRGERVIAQQSVSQPSASARALTVSGVDGHRYIAGRSRLRRHLSARLVLVFTARFALSAGVRFASGWLLHLG